MYTDFSYGKQTPTGGTRRFLELVYGLLERGYVVHLFIPRDAEIASAPRLIRHGIKTWSAGSYLIPNGVLTFIANFRILSSIRALAYDAVIVFDVPSASQLWLVGVKQMLLFIRQDFLGYRELLVGRDSWVKRTYLAVLERIERAVLLHVHRIVVQCEYDRQVLLKRHRRDRSSIDQKLCVINNNANPSWVVDATYPYSVHETRKGITLAYVGSLDDPRKGFHVLLDAVSLLLDQGEQIALHVIGGGQLLDHYRSECANRASITFWGMLANPLAVLQECDLLVVPSLADSFPNTIMEAFHLEMPVIGSSVGGIPELLRHEDQLFSPNVPDLVVKLRDIVHYGRLEAFREHSRKRKQELTFDWVGRVCELIRPSAERSEMSRVP